MLWAGMQAGRRACRQADEGVDQLRVRAGSGIRTAGSSAGRAGIARDAGKRARPPPPLPTRQPAGHRRLPTPAPPPAPTPTPAPARRRTGTTAGGAAWRQGSSPGRCRTRHPPAAGITRGVSGVLMWRSGDGSSRHRPIAGSGLVYTAAPPAGGRCVQRLLLLLLLPQRCWTAEAPTLVALKKASAPISAARSAAAVSVVKKGLPVPAPKMTTRPCSRWRMARRRMYGSAIWQQQHTRQDRMRAASNESSNK